MYGCGTVCEITLFARYCLVIPRQKPFKVGFGAPTPPWGKEQMAARGIVRIEDNGATKYVQRFPKGGEIYLFGPTNNAPGSVICAKCYAASKEADRAGWWRE